MRLHLAGSANGDVSHVLLARPEAVATARRAVLGLALTEPTRQKLALLVSELVTNSVKHAGLSPDDRVTVRFTTRGGTVRVAVHDGGQGFTPHANGSDDMLVVGGLGLVVVAELAEDWGVDSNGHGCTVWCDVALEEERATAQRVNGATGTQAVANAGRGALGRDASAAAAARIPTPPIT
jgi:anti-sigma regulatory factor (Ser/Thr protein kinase)